MADVKITKAMVLTEIRAQVEAMEFEGDVTAADVIAYCDTALAQIAAKAEKAKEKAAEKKAEGDELRAAVKAVLTDELQTREDIFAKIEGEDLSVAKIGARLTQLVANGEAVKEQVKVGDRKVMAYKLA